MLTSYLKVIKNLLLPRLCLCCEKKISKGYLCLDCEENITFLSSPRCRHCLKPLNIDSIALCQGCLKKTYPYQRLIGVTAYKEPLVSLIHLFKYKNCDYLAGFLSSLMIKHLSEISFNPNKYNLITHVPLHKDKLKIRGYNQSGLLSKLLSNHFKIPFKDDIIENTNIRPSQTKLPKEKREKNAEGIFVVKENLKNKNIILVDDIFTTGSTVNACSKALKEKQAGNITIITLSKT